MSEAFALPLDGRNDLRVAMPHIHHRNAAAEIDGYFRALSNQAKVLIRGQEFPVVGRVCMDQTMINIGDQSAFNGDEVTLLGDDSYGNVISVEDLANWAHTIPYEVLTSINQRVPRVYINHTENLT